MVMRGKLKPTANIRSERSLTNQMNADTNFTRKMRNAGYEDQLSLFAISHGVDGWYSDTYTMMVNRGATVMSKKNKRISKPGRDITYQSATNWTEAADA